MQKQDRENPAFVHQPIPKAPSRKQDIQKGCIYLVKGIEKIWDGKQWRKVCFHPTCTRYAVSTDFCKTHGGGRRCQHPTNDQGKVCGKSAIDGTFVCKLHGGGRKCNIGGCTKSAVGKTNFCKAHGGGKRCKVPNCPKSAVSPTDICIAHGGGKRCKHITIKSDNTHVKCQKSARGSTGFCIAHGGGKRCAEIGCGKALAEGSKYCISHKHRKMLEQIHKQQLLKKVKPDLSQSNEHGITSQHLIPVSETGEEGLEHGTTILGQKRKSSEHTETLDNHRNNICRSNMPSAISHESISKKVKQVKGLLPKPAQNQMQPLCSFPFESNVTIPQPNLEQKPNEHLFGIHSSALLSPKSQNITPLMTYPENNLLCNQNGISQPQLLNTHSALPYKPVLPFPNTTPLMHSTDRSLLPPVSIHTGLDTILSKSQYLTSVRAVKLMQLELLLENQKQQSIATLAEMQRISNKICDLETNAALDQGANGYIPTTMLMR